MLENRGYALKEQVNKIQSSNKIFFLFVFILIFVISIFYIWVHHKAITENEHKIQQIEKNNISISDKLKQIEKNMKEQQINQERTKTGLQSDNSFDKNKFYNKNKDILLESDNFIAQDFKKFPTFEKLVGLNESKSAAKGFINFFQNKKAFEDRGKVIVPKGLMMYGTPGCGKTVFAGSIARETELPFIEVSCSIFAQEFVGRAPKMVTELFDLAREVAYQNNKGAIIFLDECENIFLNIDSLKPGSEIANVVNEFKIQLEPKEGKHDLDKPIFVIGATNHMDGIEPAILSRFTHRIELKPGNKAERKIQLNNILQRNQFPITIEAKKYLLETINDALEYLPPQYEKKIDGTVVEISMEKNYKKAYRVLENLVKEASLKSIDREIINLQENTKCSHPNHEERFGNNRIFANNNLLKQKTDFHILENCCECKAINVEDLKKSYQIIMDESCKSLEKAENKN
ncbi:MAG: ATP-binding protein [Phytoplasma sp.]|uniref:ATP-binding protein n=1 Tax=Phytoplasma sp. TaxID=2155 RepID=UPI002B41293D|nr:ATP-binding protein [Phytoplasma sp.]WRH06575.1 MAG: ATP-binding protein [Phytoplasma sp.]